MTLPAKAMCDELATADPRVQSKATCGWPLSATVQDLEAVKCRWAAVHLAEWRVRPLPVIAKPHTMVLAFFLGRRDQVLTPELEVRLG